MGFAEYSQRLLRGHAELEAELVLLARIPSTNDLALRIAREYTCDDDTTPAVDLIAWEQTHGRGRRHRRWTSAPGHGVYASLIRSADARGLATLPLAVAVGLGTTLNRHLGDGCRLKWPNDLVVGGRKLGGILIETVGRGDAICAVIGFGVNYDAGLDDQPRATSLRRELAPGTEPPPLAALTLELIVAVDDALRTADDPLAAYRALSAHRPGDVLRWQSGGERLEGRFLGFDPRGFLRLEVDGRERQMAAGEVIEHG